MANQWGISKEVEDQVTNRDLNCVYCSISFATNSKDHKTRPTWEHIINDIRINGPNNIALCCGSCNASKGAKKLEDWLISNYCATKAITYQTVAPVVKNYLANK